MCNMAEYFFLGPTASFYGTEGKRWEVDFLQGSEGKKVFSLPFKSYYVRKGKPTLLVGKLCDLGCVPQSLPEPLLLFSHFF